MLTLHVYHQHPIRATAEWDELPSLPNTASRLFLRIRPESYRRKRNLIPSSRYVRLNAANLTTFFSEIARSSSRDIVFYRSVLLHLEVEDSAVSNVQQSVSLVDDDWLRDQIWISSVLISVPSEYLISGAVSMISRGEFIQHILPKVIESNGCCMIADELSMPFTADPFVYCSGSSLNLLEICLRIGMSLGYNVKFYSEAEFDRIYWED